MQRFDKGRREYAALIGADADHAQADLRRRAPHLFDAMIEGAFGGTLSHPELSRARRELATVSMLIALGGSERQLGTHVRAALRHGVDAAELLALAEHASVYAGFPRALNAVAVIDEVLAAEGLDRPAELRRIELADHQTVVARRGDEGPTVLLAHALGLDWRMWDEVMRRLSTGRRVFAYDIRGHGWAAGAPSPHTMAQAGRDLIGVMDALGLESAHVVGLSYGGGIAQAAAVDAPERVASLTLAATTDFPFDAFEGRARSGEVDGMPAQVAPSLTRWFTPGFLAENSWPVRYAREQVLRGNSVDWAAAWRAFIGLEVRDRLSDFASPVLILAGELDASTTPAIMKGIAERIPVAEYRELPGTPHMQSLEQPALMAEALDAFLPRA
ncbi:alpha/beta fold hydrolase [Nocardia concava]|uniref:alpha/beta fold hydrolase n=1 Tax=Nocardia concava TaxID=257281 RepID=UPI0002E3FD67|nr:alpha/beta fold hydrolase [Nocardia concava]